jgi:hypothetical protein
MPRTGQRWLVVSRGTEMLAMVDALHAEGVEVVWARRVDAAVGFLADWAVDAVVLHIAALGSDAPVLTRFIRAGRRNADVPVIAIASSGRGGHLGLPPPEGTTVVLPRTSLTTPTLVAGLAALRASGTGSPWAPPAPEPLLTQPTRSARRRHPWLHTPAG